MNVLSVWFNLRKYYIKKIYHAFGCWLQSEKKKPQNDQSERDRKYT